MLISLLMNLVLTMLCLYLYRANRKDSSTQLLNKAQFNKDIKCLKRASDVVIIIDIDKFKQINDTFGHSHGDRVIEDVSNTIKSNIRRSDRAYRIGGDEFAIITDSIAIMKRLKFTISVSMGVGECYESADRDMYNTKRGSV